MRSRSLVVLAVLGLIACLAIPVVAQERKKKTTATDFPTLLDEGKTAFAEKRYANCTSILREALGLCAVQMRKVVLECMPAAPDGFEKSAVEDEPMNSALAGAMTAGFGQSIQQEYHAKDGSGSISISVMPDSPMAATMASMAKMAALDPSSEVVKYGAESGIFKKDGADSFSIQIIIGEQHIIDGHANGIDEERFFKKFFNQDLVDKVRGALSGK